MDEEAFEEVIAEAINSPQLLTTWEIDYINEMSDCEFDELTFSQAEKVFEIGRKIGAI